ITWIPPIGHYVRLTAGAVDHIGADSVITERLGLLDGGEGDTFHRSDRRTFGDILYYGGAATIFELGPQGQINIGGNYARGPDSVARRSDNISTYSAYLNYHLSQFNRLRLQVNYAKADTELFAGAKDDWQPFLQWTITLGPHKHPFSP